MSPGATLVIVPAVVDSTTTMLEVYGSGFTAGARARIVLAGKWVYKKATKDIETIDPGIGDATVNQQGAFIAKIKVSAIRGNFATAPGVYTLKAIESDKVAATAPLVIVE